LVLSGSTLFGTTTEYGADGGGTLFSISPNGGPLTVLHPFGSIANDGTEPWGVGPLLYGSTLYGTTRYGGASGYGTIYSIGASGSDYTILYSFTGGSDGAEPNALMLAWDGMIYGTAFSGGSSGYGTIFGFAP
jgi:uncharacterized repeat protein (TIGR03803 family)